MDDQTAFESRAKQVLDESTSRLDGATRSKLTQARYAALDQLQRPARRWWRGFVPVGAVAAAAVVAVIVWTGRVDIDSGATMAATTNSAFDDLELLADGEAPDFTEGDDLEFYEWAAGEVES